MRVWDEVVVVGVTCAVGQLAFGTCGLLVCVCLEWGLFWCVVTRGVYSWVWLRI